MASFGPAWVCTKAAASRHASRRFCGDQSAGNAASVTPKTKRAEDQPGRALSAPQPRQRPSPRQAERGDQEDEVARLGEHRPVACQQTVRRAGAAARARGRGRDRRIANCGRRIADMPGVSAICRICHLLFAVCCLTGTTRPMTASIPAPTVSAVNDPARPLRPAERVDLQHPPQRRAHVAERAARRGLAAAHQPRRASQRQEQEPNHREGAKTQPQPPSRARLFPRQPPAQEHPRPCHRQQERAEQVGVERGGEAAERRIADSRLAD